MQVRWHACVHTADTPHVPASEQRQRPEPCRASHNRSRPCLRRRPGWFCPTPAVEVPCPPGAWCTQAAVAPTTCEYPVLMAEQPDRTVPDEPLTIVQRVYGKGEPLGGNICPPVLRATLRCALDPAGVPPGVACTL